MISSHLHCTPSNPRWGAWPVCKRTVQCARGSRPHPRYPDALGRDKCKHQYKWWPSSVPPEHSPAWPAAGTTDGKPWTPGLNALASEPFTSQVTACEESLSVLICWARSSLQHLLIALGPPCQHKTMSHLGGRPIGRKRASATPYTVHELFCYFFRSVLVFIFKHLIHYGIHEEMHL